VANNFHELLVAGVLAVNVPGDLAHLGQVELARPAPVKQIERVRDHGNLGLR
jgi:hypothetical protein